MVTVFRASGLRFVIYTDDHDPAHLHVYGDGEARIAIDKLAVISNRGMSKRDLTRALNIVTDNQQIFLEKWHDIHG